MEDHSKYTGGLSKDLKAQIGHPIQNDIYALIFTAIFLQYGLYLPKYKFCLVPLENLVMIPSFCTSILNWAIHKENMLCEVTPNLIFQRSKEVHEK